MPCINVISFQSLSGIMVVSHCKVLMPCINVISFQSLSGIMVVSHCLFLFLLLFLSVVSIPFRDYGGFPRQWDVPARVIAEVSIPFRDYGGFPQSIKTFSPFVEISFNPFQGLWWFPTLLPFYGLNSLFNGFNPFQGLWWFPTINIYMNNLKLVLFQSLSGIMVVSHQP